MSRSTAHYAKGTELKGLGTLISADLFWEFKEAQARRRESPTQALENALRLYIDISKKSKEEDK